VNLADLVLRSYATRQCFVCEQFGPCKHREFDVEVAFILKVSKIGPRSAGSLSLVIGSTAAPVVAGARA